MAFANIYTKEFEDFAKKIEHNARAKPLYLTVGNEMQKMSASLLGNVVKRTPVKTGTLRRAWNSTGMHYDGINFYFEIFNNAEYASFVENGHRTVGKRGWVKGKFFLKDTLDIYSDIEADFWNKTVSKAIEEIFDD